MNVIGSRPDGWWRDRPRAWRRLTRSLESYASSTGDDLTVVFDGRRPHRWRDDDLVEVTFAGGGPGAADEVIVARVGADPHPEALRVITSDRELADRVRALGAEVLSAQSFLERLESR